MICAEYELSQQTPYGFECSNDSSFSATNHLEADFMSWEERKKEYGRIYKLTHKKLCPICQTNRICKESNSCRSCSKKNENHAMWRGDDVSYSALHTWIRKNKPKPELCENCGINPPKDLHSIGHTYLRDVTQWKWLCRKCHYGGSNSPNWKGGICSNEKEYKKQWAIRKRMKLNAEKSI